jgi:excisionase family DNA binding protein
MRLDVPPDVLDALADAVALRLGAQHQQQRQQTQWLTVPAAAKHLSTSTHRIYRLVHLRRIPHVKEGQRLLFDRAALDDWVRKGGARVVAR